MLKTQAGICRIDQIADLPGVGTVWFYPEGVANILSMNKLIMGSGWDIDFHRKKKESCVTQANTVYLAKAKFILTRIGHSQINTVYHV